MGMFFVLFCLLVALLFSSRILVRIDGNYGLRAEGRTCSVVLVKEHRAGVAEGRACTHNA